MKIAYVDCFAGAAGDMIVAAMLGAGLDREFLLRNLRSLEIGPVDYPIQSVVRHGISAFYFEPRIDPHPPSDYRENVHHHHPHDHDPHQSRQDRCEKEIHTYPHAHRNLSEIRRIIQRSGISVAAKRNAEAIFERLGTVEAFIHGQSIDEVHFHEVGAVDSIVDIVAACVGFDALGIDKVICSPLAVGSGVVQCAHGLLPIPAPATAELLRQAKAPMVPGPGCFEMLTPTAAAILTHFAHGYGLLESMTIDSIGYGAGSRDPEGFPNVLRLLIGHTDVPLNTDNVLLLECNIDDSPAEQIGFVFDQVLKAGALDVFTTSIQMKNSRPAVTLSVLCDPSTASKLEATIFKQGLTLGIRKQILQRSILARQIVSVDTCYGSIHIKTASYEGRQVFIKPEYSECAAAALKYSVSLGEVYRQALTIFHELHRANNGNPSKTVNP